MLRALGLLEKAAEEEAEETQAQEEAVAPVVAQNGACSNVPDVPAALKKTGIDTSHCESEREQQVEQQVEQQAQKERERASEERVEKLREKADEERERKLREDAEDVLVAVEEGTPPTIRAVAKHFGWGTRRALAALRKLREDGDLP